MECLFRNLELLNHGWNTAWHWALTSQKPPRDWNGCYHMMIYGLPHSYHHVYQSQPGYKRDFNQYSWAAVLWRSRETAEAAQKLFWERDGVRSYLSPSNGL